MTDADEVLRAAAEWIWLPPGTERAPAEDYLLVAMPAYTDNPTQVLRTDSDRAPATLIDEVREQVRRWERPSVGWWVSGVTRPSAIEEELQAAGAQREETLAVLARPLDDVGPASSLEVRVVDDLATFRDFEHVESAVFGGSAAPDDAAQAELADVRRALADATGVSMVGYVDGVPVTAAGASLADGFCRLWGGATLAEARGRGAYRDLLAARVAWGHAHGARTALVKGRVETSAPILRRLGFTAYGEERSYRLDV